MGIPERTRDTRRRAHRTSGCRSWAAEDFRHEHRDVLYVIRRHLREQRSEDRIVGHPCVEGVEETLEGGHPPIHSKRVGTVVSGTAVLLPVVSATTVGASTRVGISSMPFMKGLHGSEEGLELRARPEPLNVPFLGVPEDPEREAVRRERCASSSRDAPPPRVAHSKVVEKPGDVVDSEVLAQRLEHLGIRGDRLFIDCEVDLDRQVQRLA